MFLIFSIFLMLRGHNFPGGGFTGGLVAAAGFVLYAIAFGARTVRRSFKLDLKQLIGLGLGTALFSGIISIFNGRPFFSGIWTTVNLPTGTVHVGTPVLFDLGVYFVVLGVVLTIVLTRMEED